MHLIGPVQWQSFQQPVGDLNSDRQDYFPMRDTAQSFLQSKIHILGSAIK